MNITNTITSSAPLNYVTPKVKGIESTTLIGTIYPIQSNPSMR